MDFDAKSRKPRRFPIRTLRQSPSPSSLVHHFKQCRHRRTGRQLIGNHIRQPRLVQKHIDMGRKPFPQAVGQALCPRARDAARSACPCVHRIHRFIDRTQDIGHTDVRSRARQTISTSRPAHAFHKACPPQFHEQLLKIGQRDILPALTISAKDKHLVADPPGQGRSVPPSRNALWY